MHISPDNQLAVETVQHLMRDMRLSPAEQEAWRDELTRAAVQGQLWAGNTSLDQQIQAMTSRVNTRLTELRLQQPVDET